MLLLLACSQPDAPVAAAPSALLLAHVPPAGLELPTLQPAAGPWPVTGPWKAQRTEGGVTEYRANSPVLNDACLVDPTTKLQNGASTPARVEYPAALAPDTFAVRGTGAFLRLDAGDAPPEDRGWTLECASASAAEDQLRLRDPEVPPDELVWEERSVRGATQEGVYLPAPASVSWSVTVPEDGIFTATAYRLPPLIRSAAAPDGASLTLELEVDGVTESVGSWPAELAGTAIRADLKPHSGKQATLRLRTTAGGNPAQDYAFVAEPALYRPSAKPRRLVMVFIDTLRADHLGYAGYGRPTSPTLDALAERGTVYTQARSVAGWTLPSTMSALSGRLPHRWDEGDTLAETLSDAGFATAATVTNHFIAPSFGVARGWGYYGLAAARSATEQTDTAIALLRARSDRDVALLVHYIDPHVPYAEPEPYRSLWAGAEPAGFPAKVDRNKLADFVGRDLPNTPEPVRDYVTARYDQEIRYVDTELARLFAEVGDDATIVVFSDHGEELWDHGAYEHGHTNHEELLRVPLIIRSPRMDAGRVDAPASLLDIAPTVAELFGLAAPQGDGRSLVGLANGAEDPTFSARPLAFGWKLYGGDRWGVVRQGYKWEARQGGENLYNLKDDPEERKDLAATADLQPHRAAFVEASGLPLPRVWRVQVLRGSKSLDQEVRVTLRSAGGFTRVWTGYDYLGPASKYHLETELSGDEATLVQAPGATLPTEVFAAPNDPDGELRVVLTVGTDTKEGVVSGATDAAGSGKLLDLKLGVERVLVRAGLTAELPVTEAAPMSDSTLRQLRALGYAD